MSVDAGRVCGAARLQVEGGCTRDLLVRFLQLLDMGEFEAGSLEIGSESFGVEVVSATALNRPAVLREEEARYLRLVGSEA